MVASSGPCAPRGLCDALAYLAIPCYVMPCFAGDGDGDRDRIVEGVGREGKGA